jgi:hypothetical protein
MFKIPREEKCGSKALGLTPHLSIRAGTRLALR